MDCNNNVSVSTKSNITLNAGNIILGGENTVKGQSLLQWLNTHTHLNGNNGGPTGPVSPDTVAKDTLLVKEQ